jgi:DNA-binding response OmpR family regulator
MMNLLTMPSIEVRHGGNTPWHPQDIPDYYRTMKINGFLPAPKPTCTPAQSLPNAGPHILVVDDEPLIRRINSEILTDAGYHVDAAEDGAVAWDVLQRKNYDLLITDNQMPKVSGVELLKKIRVTGMTLPVIMSTGTLPDEKFERHGWLQPFAMLLKPYSLVELLGTVKAVLHAGKSGGKPMVLAPNWECQPLAFGVRLNSP